MCTTGEAPGSGRERNSEDRPAATGPDEFHADRSPVEFEAGPEAAADDPANDPVASFPCGEDSPMEPVIADFPDNAGATEEPVGAGVGVVIGAVVTADGVALASWPSPAVGGVLFGVPTDRPASAVFETPSPGAAFGTALPVSLLNKFADAVVAIPFRFGRDGDTEKWFLIALGLSYDHASASRCSRAEAFALGRAVAADLLVKSIVSPDFVGAGKLRASSFFKGAGVLVGASAVAITRVPALGA